HIVVDRGHVESDVESFTVRFDRDGLDCFGEACCARFEQIIARRDALKTIRAVAGRHCGRPQTIVTSDQRYRRAGDAGVVRVRQASDELGGRLRRNEWRVESEKQKEVKRRWNPAHKGEPHKSSFPPPFAGLKRTRSQAGLLALGIADCGLRIAELK